MFSIRPSALFFLIALGAVGCLEDNPQISPSDMSTDVPVNVIIRYTYFGTRRIEPSLINSENFRLSECAKPSTETSEESGSGQKKSAGSTDSNTTSGSAETKKTPASSDSGAPVAGWVGMRTYKNPRTWAKTGATENLMRTEVVFIPKPSAENAPPLKPEADYCFEAAELREEGEKEGEYGTLVPAVSKRFTTVSKEKANFRFSSLGTGDMENGEPRRADPARNSASAVQTLFPKSKSLSLVVPSDDPANIIFRFSTRVNPLNLDTGTHLCWRSLQTNQQNALRLTNDSADPCRGDTTVDRQLVMVESIPKKDSSAPKGFTTMQYKTYALVGGASLTDTGSYNLRLRLESDESSGNIGVIPFSVAATGNLTAETAADVLAKQKIPDPWYIPIGKAPKK